MHQDRPHGQKRRGSGPSKTLRNLFQYAHGGAVRKVLPEEFVVPKAQSSAQRQSRCASFFAVVVLLCSMLAIAVMWQVSLQQGEEVVDALTVKYREAIQHATSLRIANLIRPLWQIPTEYSARYATGTETSLSGADSFGDQSLYEELVFSMYSVVQDSYHEFSSSFIGTVAVLALGSGGNLSSSISGCSNAVFASTLIDPSPGAPPGSYISDRQVLDEASPNGVTRTMNALFVDSLTTQEIGIIPPAPCAVAMSPLWGNGQPTEDTAHGNFSWFGPFDPGAGFGMHFEGNVPIYDADGRSVGRFGGAFSLSRSVPPMLERVLEYGGEVMRGGEAALLTASGTLLGHVGPSSATEKPVLVTANLTSWVRTKVYQEIMRVNDSYQSFCPPTPLLETTTDGIMDFTPFAPEDFGLPPLNEPWCFVTVFPRDNVYSAIDRANRSQLSVMILTSVGSTIAVLFVTLALRFEGKQKQALQRDRDNQNNERVIASIRGVNDLAAPMVLIAGAEFLQLGRLRPHEELRDAGKLCWLDSLEAIRSFRRSGNMIVFLSHQWLDRDGPDPAGSHYEAMCAIVRALQRDIGTDRKLFVWVDFISIAQRHKGMLAMAVSSLPTYAATCDAFVIVAPTCSHIASGSVCDLESYNRRGWCRAEMLAKICGTGVSGMYTFAHLSEGHRLNDAEGAPWTNVVPGADPASDPQMSLNEVMLNDLETLSLRVFEGDFTVREDMESLVEPVLGLYSLVLRRRNTNANIRKVYEHIEADRARFFPRTYSCGAGGREKVLFGPLVELLEARCGEARVRSVQGLLQDRIRTFLG